MGNLKTFLHEENTPSYTFCVYVVVAVVFYLAFNTSK